MGRPMYETADHRLAEDAVRDLIAVNWRCKVEKMPISYKLDFAAVRERIVVAFLEVKCRQHRFGQYPTLMLSAAKWQAGCALAETYHIPFGLVIGWQDGVYWCRAQNDPSIRLEWGGRSTQTRDSADIEPVVHVPVGQFKPLIAS